VIRPYGYAIWERMVAEEDARIKAAGAENASFPVFIPESYFRREADHVEGFSPELAVVTFAGGKPLDEPIVVRPTSETVVGEYMAKWIQSYRDLPLLLNLWNSVVRWELRPRLFLRTTEFQWQEGHTAHTSREAAAEYARRILHDVYEDFIVNVLAIPVVIGCKTARERFAGAINTLTLEGMMGDGKALQMGTSHELGQNFAKVFDIDYLDDTGARQLCWTTSWGSSARMVGGLIMGHGDDRGLVLPPRLAPTQVVVLAVGDEGRAVAAARDLVTDLNSRGVRTRLDARTDQSFGRRSTDWELKGVPVRLEVGPRDVAAGNVTVVRRDRADKTPIPLADVVERTVELLATIQADLLRRAVAARDDRIIDVATLDEAVDAAATGWAKLPWSTVGGPGEQRLAEVGVTVRCLQRPDGSVPDHADEPDLIAYCARAY
jgi:prolyl-tRNA synthetase